MAVDIGPKIGIQGDQEYKKSISDIIQQTKLLKSEMKATASEWDKDTSAQQKNAAQRKNLTQQIELQKKRVEETRRMLEQSKQAYGENAKETKTWETRLNEATATLNKMEGELKMIPNDIQTMGESMKSAGEKIKGVGDALMPISAAAAAGLGASAKLAMDFEGAMAKVSTIADTTTVPVDQLRQSILDLSNDTGISAKEIAENVYSAISAGQETGKAVDFVRTSTQLATAGFADAGQSLDVLTTIMNAYGESAGTAESISDKLITTQNMGKTTVAELASSMGKVIPTANMYGVSLDNIASAYVTTTKNGIATAESTTYINSMMNELGKNGGKAAEILKKRTGKTFKELMDSGKDLGDVLQILADESKETGKSIGDMFGSQEAAKAAATLIQHTEDFDEALQAMQKSAGATEKAYGKMADTAQHKLKVAMEQVKNTGIEVGSTMMTTLAPALEDVGQDITKLTQWFAGLDDGQKKLIVEFGLVVAAAGPLISTFGSLVTAGGTIVSGIGGMVASFGAAEGAALTFGAALGPLGIALAAVAAAMIAMGASTKDIPPELLTLQGSMTETKTQIDAVKQANEELAASMQRTADAMSTGSAPLEYWRDQLMQCFDSSGHLKEGMEEVAEYALGQLNQAMGSDYSSEFIRQGSDCTKTLEEINGAIDANIEKMKEQALVQAFSEEWAAAIKAQSEASAALASAENEAKTAIDGHTQAQKDLIEAQKGDRRGEGMTGEIAAATAAEHGYAAAAQETATAYKDIATESAEADARVSSLRQAMDLLSHGKVDEAAEAYANAGVKAEEAGQKASQAAQDSLEQWQQLSKEKIMPPEIDQAAAAQNATTTTTTMQGVFDSNQFTGYVQQVNGGDAAATAAHGQMDGIVKQPMRGSISGVDGADSAARSAWHTMKSFFVSNPITVAIKGVVTSGTGNRYSERAEGGFIRQQQVALIGEDGPEVIIPLSAGKRARAMDLFSQTAAILGVGANAKAYLPASGVSSNTMNMGGVNINVYGAEGQDVHELAREVADIVQSEVDSKGAVWGTS